MALRDLVRMGDAGKKAVARHREPGDPFLSLRREMNDLFERFFQGFDVAPFDWPASPFASFTPRVDVAETDREIEVSAALPGIDEKDIDVSLSDGMLTIQGERKEEREDEERDWYRREQAYGSFQRIVPLPCEVDETKVEATFKKGVLKIHLPKAESAQRKRVQVKVE